MAKINLGDRQADWDTKADLVWPTRNLSDDDVYYFFMESVPANLVWRRQYLNLFARYTATGGSFESPLIAKFFANGFPMIFTVSVPGSSITANPTPVAIVARPREFYAGAGTVRLGTVRASFEDANSLPNITGYF